MAATVSFYRLEDLSADQRRALTLRTEADLSAFMAQVEPVIAAVKCRGRFLPWSGSPASSIKAEITERQGERGRVRRRIRTT